MSARMNSKAPAQKVNVGALGGALTTLLLFSLPEEWLFRSITPGIEAALTTVIIFVLQYLVPPGKTEKIINK